MNKLAVVLAVIIFLSSSLTVNAQTTREAFDETMISEQRVKEVFESMDLRINFDDGHYLNLYNVESVTSIPTELELNGYLTKSGGTFEGPSGHETWYNRPMGKCIDNMSSFGYSLDNYRVRDDGVKMLGEYVMCAANTETWPKGSLIPTSLGKAIVVDHCEAGNVDICVTW